MRYEKQMKSRAADWEESPRARKIVAAARELFLEKGYKSVTTRQIAERAGVNLGLIPYYFETKDKLASLICREIKNETYREILRMVDLHELPAAERLYVYTLLRWRHLLKERDGEFVLDLFADGAGDVSASDEFSAMSWDIIREHKLDISFAKNELYLTALAGAEQLLVAQMGRAN